MAQVIPFPAQKPAQPLRSLSRPSYPLSTEPRGFAMKAICEAIIFGGFLIGLVMMIYAMGAI